MKIWIDLANSPHPLLFAPIVQRLEELGHRIELTVRDTAQTLELAHARWPGAEAIGGMTPRTRAAKTAAIAKRVDDLRRWARRRSFDLALSHNSYAQIVAARTLGVHVVTAMDFEHQRANHLAFRLAHRILLPEALLLEAVRAQGAHPAKVAYYGGLKEELIFADFEPDPNALAAVGVDPIDGAALVVARTPNPRASYVTDENPLFLTSLRTLADRTDVQCLVLVRHDDERAALAALAMQNLVVPRHAVDSRSLMYAADLVIGGGGTMTREAAVLRVPTLTAYAGTAPAVDRQLEADGLLQRLTSPSQVAQLRLRAHDPRPAAELRARGRALAEQFVGLALNRQKRSVS
jgi:uncharacterized protein